jgi:hypothetical protein
MRNGIIGICDFVRIRLFRADFSVPIAASTGHYDDREDGFMGFKVQ